MEVKNKIKDVLVRLLKIRPEEIKDDLSLEGCIGVDSTEMVETVIALEKEFQVKFAQKEITKFSSLNDIEKVICAKLK